MILVPITFITILTVVLGLYWFLIVRPERHVHQTLRRRLQTARDARAARLDLLKQVEQLSSIPALNRALGRAKARLGPIERLIHQAGVPVTVSTFLAASGVCAFLAALVVLRLTGIGLAAVVCGAAAALGPTSFLRMRRTRRLRRFEEQFPEALDLMSRALKAGHAFPTGILMVADEMPEPVGPEFRLLYDQQNYGMALPDAIKAFADRIPLIDGRFFATAILIQRESGGNLSEVLENLASVIRDRFRVKRQIRVISAHGRLTGWVLTAIPPALAALLFTLNPEHWTTLTTDPLGEDLILAAMVLQLAGGLIIRRLVRIEY